MTRNEISKLTDEQLHKAIADCAGMENHPLAQRFIEEANLRAEEAEMFAAMEDELGVYGCNG